MRTENVMKLTSKVLPYSRSVGGGLMLVDEDGRRICQVSFVAMSDVITEEQLIALTRNFDHYVHLNGLEISSELKGKSN
jgi:hypothetical protein